MTNKDIFEFTLTLFQAKGVFDKDKGVSAHKRILIEEFSYFEKALKLGKLYKELSNYVDDESYAYELPEIILLKIKIKELENEKNILYDKLVVY